MSDPINLFHSSGDEYEDSATGAETSRRLVTTSPPSTIPKRKGSRPSSNMPDMFSAQERTEKQYRLDKHQEESKKREGHRRAAAKRKHNMSMAKHQKPSTSQTVITKRPLAQSKIRRSGREDKLQSIRNGRQSVSRSIGRRQVQSAKHLREMKQPAHDGVSPASFYGVDNNQRWKAQKKPVCDIAAPVSSLSAGNNRPWKDQLLKSAESQQLDESSSSNGDNKPLPATINQGCALKRSRPELGKAHRRLSSMDRFEPKTRKRPAPRRVSFLVFMFVQYE